MSGTTAAPPPGGGGCCIPTRTMPPGTIRLGAGGSGSLRTVRGAGAAFDGCAETGSGGSAGANGFGVSAGLVSENSTFVPGTGGGGGTGWLDVLAGFVRLNSMVGCGTGGTGGGACTAGGGGTADPAGLVRCSVVS